MKSPGSLLNKISGISIKMPYYRSRKMYRSRKRKMRRTVNRGLRIGGGRWRLRGLVPTKNYYKFARFGENCTIDSVAAGTVGLNTLANGWSLTSASTDHNGTYQFGGAMQFQLDQVLNHSDFVLLFDRYKIKGVKVTFIPLGQPSTNATTINLADTNYASIAVAVDSDDASLPTSWNEVAQKQDCKIRRLSKPLSVYIANPKLAAATYDGVATAYTTKTGFLDMAKQDVPHYGLKFYIRDCPLPAPPSGANGANVSFRVVTKFYLALKDPQ